MRTVLVIFCILLLAGCTSSALVRVVEYGGGGVAGMFTGGIGGCSIYQLKGSEVFADVSLTYKGEKCSAEVMIDAPAKAESGFSRLEGQ